MTYSLPFGLTQKTTNKYFEHGVIKFAVREGKLFYTIKLINKTVNGVIQQGEVKSKAFLDKIMSINTVLQFLATKAKGFETVDQVLRRLLKIE